MRIRNPMRKVLTVFQGLIFGFVAYLPIMLFVEFVAYWRIDGEKAFYALYYPLGAHFLFVPSNWRYVRPEEIILNILGGALLVVGLIYFLRRGNHADA
jgi:CDP-diglyceride synthetase